MRDVIPALVPSRSSRRSILFGLAASSLLLLGQAVEAVPPAATYSSSYAVRLEDEQGNALATFRQNGTTFVLGDLGERYNVRIENHSDRRVEAVLTLDGRDAVSGAPGDFVNERGYLVPAHGSVLVDGFRQSLEQSAAFRFSRPEASYSSRMGTPENVGVIGVAFFPERRLFPVHPPVRAPRPGPRWRTPWDESSHGYRSEKSSPAPSAREAEEAPAKRRAPSAASGGSYDSARDSAAGDDLGRAAPRGLGTEYGESQYSPVTEVPFERQNPARPDVLLSVRYDDAEGLTARGIDVYPHTYWPDAASSPSPFPVNRFAPPPW